MCIRDMSYPIPRTIIDVSGLSPTDSATQQVRMTSAADASSKPRASNKRPERRAIGRAGVDYLFQQLAASPLDWPLTPRLVSVRLPHWLSTQPLGVAVSVKDCALGVATVMS